ncbi:hypothetical protein BELL_0150g00060 [Botrytis elliptica]|uniref:Uncharacterized protein n=1 Tax=Botrytis elliptica TaxID=278938 RepID=A0A4Z1JSA3_9HELO|nr:hypothetical protein EAE99_012042 [Botrytis elliptica]TGO76535.1 hypothetical protein BELL_0150g00060 [Botrytis elliptica]
MKKFFHSDCCRPSDNGDINLPNRPAAPSYRPGDRVMIREEIPCRVVSNGMKNSGQIVNGSSVVDIRFTYRVRLVDRTEQSVHEPHLRMANDNDAGPFPDMP